MTGYSLLKLSTDEQNALAKLHSTFPLNILPDSVKPYAELIRISKPAGVRTFFFPFLYGTFLIGALHRECGTGELLWANTRLGLLAFLMRASFCTWNDILDHDLDRQVTRTRIRPLARMAISTSNAFTFLAIQIVLLEECIRVLTDGCLAYALPCLMLHLLYPMAKRVTNHPQFVLGLAFASEILIPFPLLCYPTLLDTTNRVDLISALGVGGALVWWTLLYDTIYAAQDLTDDKRVGIGSTMVYWEAHARDFLRVLAVLTITSLSLVSCMISQSSITAAVIYSVLTCGAGGLGLIWMVEQVKIYDSIDCAWWFGTGNLWVGLLLGSGLFGAHIGQVYF